MATRAHTVEDAPEANRCFTGNLAWLLYRAHWALASELTAALAPVGVTPRAYHVLHAALSGEYTQTELADMIGLDKTTMVVTVDELERDGLAERRPSPHDRRARIIAVTTAGKRKVAEAGGVRERARPDIPGDLRGRDKKALIAALDRLGRAPPAERVDSPPPLRRRTPRS